MKYSKQLDTFRFFAAFAVLTSHWLHYSPIVQKLHLGSTGVNFFFVISGFLISYQLFELRESIELKKIKFWKAIKNFTLRRGFRIFPLYYVVLLAATLFNKGEIRDAFIYNLTYTSNFYFIEIQKWTSTFSHFWSLSVEEHFYLVWPIIVLFFKRRFILPIMAVIATGSILYRYYIFTYAPDYLTAYVHTFACLDVFMVGALLAYFLKWYKEHFLLFFESRTIRYSILVVFAITYGSLTIYEDSLIFAGVFFRTLFSIASAGIIGLLIIGFSGLPGRIFENKWLVKGGRLSYGIYLVHNFVPGILLEIKKLGLPTAIEFIIYLITTIIISAILYKLIETPMRRIGQKFKVKIT